MRVGLISDTHAPAMGAHPPVEVARAFAGVDLILHAGDIYSSQCLDWLERIAPVLAVEVPPALAFDDPRVARKRVVKVEGYAIGLVHDLVIRGYGFEVVPGIIERQLRDSDSLAELLEHVFDERVDAVVFGDTHVPMVERHQGILFVNPGSPVLPRQVIRLGTVALLDAAEGGPEARIVELSSFSEPDSIGGTGRDEKRREPS